MAVEISLWECGKGHVHMALGDIEYVFGGADDFYAFTKICIDFGGVLTRRNRKRARRESMPAVFMEVVSKLDGLDELGKGGEEDVTP